MIPALLLIFFLVGRMNRYSYERTGKCEAEWGNIRGLGSFYEVFDKSRRFETFSLRGLAKSHENMEKGAKVSAWNCLNYGIIRMYEIKGILEYHFSR